MAEGFCFQISPRNKCFEVGELQKLAQPFNMATNPILNYNGKIPKEIVIEDKTTV